MLEIQPQFLRVRKAAETYGVSESFLRHALMERKITPYKFGKNTFVNIPEMDSVIASGRVD